MADRLKKIIDHQERAEEIFSAIRYFDGMAKKWKENAILPNNEDLYKRFMHKSDIASRSRRRMEQLYIKHLRNLTL